VESGEFYWSTGLFLCNANTLFHSLEADDPYISRFYELPKTAIVKDELLKIVRDHYPRNRYQSIDLLILEHNKNVFIQSCTFGWKDIGSWQDYYSISLKDSNRNVVNNARTSLYNCHDNVVIVSNEKIVLLQDLEGYLIIEKDNVIMICKKDDTAQIRRMMTDAEVKYNSSLS
jgi:Mannose-1-phosphate guanylyltransferase